MTYIRMRLVNNNTFLIFFIIFFLKKGIKIPIWLLKSKNRNLPPTTNILRVLVIIGKLHALALNLVRSGRHTRKRKSNDYTLVFI